MSELVRHQDYAGAERAIGWVTDGLSGVAPRPVYNIFGETLEVHTSDQGAGNIVNVTEVLALIWSMQQIMAPRPKSFGAAGY